MSHWIGGERADRTAMPLQMAGRGLRPLSRGSPIMGRRCELGPRHMPSLAALAPVKHGPLPFPEGLNVMRHRRDLRAGWRRQK